MVHPGWCAQHTVVHWPGREGERVYMTQLKQCLGLVLCFEATVKSAPVQFHKLNLLLCRWARSSLSLNDILLWLSTAVNLHTQIC